MRRALLAIPFLLSAAALNCSTQVDDPEPELTVTENADEPCGPCTWIDHEGQCVSEGTYCPGRDPLGNDYYLCCPQGEPTCHQTNEADGSITASCGGGGSPPPPPGPGCPQGPCNEPQCRDPYPNVCGLGCCAVNETCVGDGLGCCPPGEPACGNGCCPYGSICTNGTCAF